MNYSKTLDLSTNEELRIEVNESQRLKIKVIKGIAEVKGKELLRENVFTDVKTAVYSFTGCQLEVEGEADLLFLSRNSPFPAIFGVFDKINKDLDDGKISNVLLLGNGKSTAAVTLCNFFVRLHKKVAFTEIDPSKGNVFPGALSIMQVENLSDPFFDLNNPFCLFHGSKEVNNFELYEMQVKALAEKSKGFNCPNVVLAPDLEPSMLHSVIESFNISYLMIVGDERLYCSIISKLEVKEERNRWGDFLKVKNLSLQSFFVENLGFIQENKVAKAIKRYFYGQKEFTPSRLLINKNNISVLKLGEDFAAPESALPLGSSRKLGLMGIEEVEMQEGSVLGISIASDKESVMTAPVAGFAVCIDEKKGMVLCSQSKLPSKAVYLIQGNIKFIDY